MATDPMVRMFQDDAHRLRRILRELVNVPAIVNAVNPSGQRHQGACECPYCLALCEVYGKPERPAQETKVNLPEIPPGSMPPDPGPDPTKLEYDEWVARTRECPSCHGQGCEPAETDDGRLLCGPGCQRCEGAGRISL